MSVWSPARQQSLFQQYHSEKHLSEFYPQDGVESQLASKLRHCHAMCIGQLQQRRRPISMDYLSRAFTFIDFDNYLLACDR